MKSVYSNESATRRTALRAVSLAAALIILLTSLSLISCEKKPSGDDPSIIETKDYASLVHLDLTSGYKKQEVTVKTYVDGDTTHFHVPESVVEGGVLKARYLAINTPESTGKIEEWGKKASNFTHEKLAAATSIYIESDTENWDVDSTGGRYLVWVWYKTSDSSEYRNLNIEILQNGLAIASSSANNRYGSVCMDAIAAAKAAKRNIYSGEKDPDFYYGSAVELTLRELRTNINEYNGVKVAFEGVITLNSSNTVYVEEIDPESGICLGMPVYYGFGLSGAGLDVLSVGNRVRIVGTVQYYEAGGSWQISGLSYREMKPDDPGNIQKLGEGYSPVYAECDIKTFSEGKIALEVGDETREFKISDLMIGSTVSMKGLHVDSVYTTDNPDSSSNGAMTLTCSADGEKITVRTVVLRDENGNLVTEDLFKGKTVDVRGIVDVYDGKCQIKLIELSGITIH